MKIQAQTGSPRGGVWKYSPTGEITEDVLVALRDGDHEAYRMIYLQFAGSLVDFVEKLVKQRDVAEDITQEIMIDVWEKRSRINIHTSVKGYLFTIARHAVYNYFRSRHAIDPIEDYERVATPEGSRGSDEQLIARETDMFIQLIVHKMPRQRRTIFEMSNNEGLTNEQIALKLDISKTAVEKQISYARREIRDMLVLLLVFATSIR
jgi:RNA polymerase sigma-70 factor (ECF subfamily)